MFRNETPLLEYGAEGGEGLVDVGALLEPVAGRARAVGASERFAFKIRERPFDEVSLLCADLWAHALPKRVSRASFSSRLPKVRIGPETYRRCFISNQETETPSARSEPARSTRFSFEYTLPAFVFKETL